MRGRVFAAVAGLIGSFCIAAQLHAGPPPAAPIIIDPSFQVPVREPNPCLQAWCFVNADLSGRRVAIVGAALPAVYVHVRDRAGAWQLETVLMSPHSTGETPDATETEQMFGDEIALQGRNLLVSAVRNDIETGRQRPIVYVFRRGESGWGYVQTIELTGEANQTFDLNALKLGARRALIGSTQSTHFEDRIESQETIHAYRKGKDGVFRFETSLLLDEPATEGLRQALAIDQRTIVAGAPWENAQTGAVYVFERKQGSWMRTQKLVSDQAQSGGQFGRDLDIDGRILAIGHPGVPASLERPGSVEIFKRNHRAWMQTDVLVNPFTTPDIPDFPHFRNFGQTVEVQDKRLLAGGVTSFMSGDGTTMVYLYKLHRGEWIPTVRLRGDAPIYTRLTRKRVLTVVDRLRTGVEAYVYEL